MEKASQILETYTRIFVEEHGLDAASAFYQELTGGTETMRFAYPQHGLKLASVSSAKWSVLLIAGPPERRKPFEATRVTVKVKNLDIMAPLLVAGGASQIEPIQITPVGRKMRFQHADGLVVEYVENNG
jgi:hypothetical protein